MSAPWSPLSLWERPKWREEGTLHLGDSIISLSLCKRRSFVFAEILRIAHSGKCSNIGPLVLIVELAQSRLMRLEMDWCGLMWLDVARCGLNWLDMAWYGFMWLDMAWYGLIWLNVAWCGLNWLELTCCGLTRLDVAWCGLLWLDVVQCGSTLEVDRVPENPTRKLVTRPDPRLFLQNPTWPETRNMKTDPTQNPKIDPKIKNFEVILGFLQNFLRNVR